MVDNFPCDLLLHLSILGAIILSLPRGNDIIPKIDGAGELLVFWSAPEEDIVMGEVGGRQEYIFGGCGSTFPLTGKRHGSLYAYDIHFPCAIRGKHFQS